MTVAARVGNGIIAVEMANWGRGENGWSLLLARNRPGQQVRSFAYLFWFCDLRSAGFDLLQPAVTYWQADASTVKGRARLAAGWLSDFDTRIPVQSAPLVHAVEPAEQEGARKKVR